MYTYKTKGTCSRKIECEIEGDILKKVRFTNGCDGNLEGISRLVEGMPVEKVIEKLKGIKCQGDTSCPDQLARALEEYLRSNEGAAAKVL